MDKYLYLEKIPNVVLLCNPPAWLKLHLKLLIDQTSITRPYACNAIVTTFSLALSLRLSFPGALDFFFFELPGLCFLDEP